MNFIRTSADLPSTSPIVFRQLTEQNGQHFLEFGGDLKTAFAPEKLFIDKSTGVLMHDIDVPAEHEHISYGSLDASLALEILDSASEETSILW